MAISDAPRRTDSDRTLIAVYALCLCVSVGLKFWGLLHKPLWLDEAWTGAIIAQPNIHGLVNLITLDVNAPLYYGLMALWRSIFGLSDLALRTPSLIAAMATPLAPLAGLRRRSGPFPLSLADRLVWSGLLALWIPSVTYADEARCYALLLLLVTVQAVAVIRLMAKPGLGRAFAWSISSALAILTHYDAVFTTGFEGLFLLFALRGVLRDLWPSALALLPAGGWMVYHLPRVAAFAQPGVAWYPLVEPAMAPAIAGYIIAAPGLLRAVIAILVLTAVAGRLAGPWPRAAFRLNGPMIVAAASLLSAAVLTGLGVWRPTFTLRYLIPSAPGCFLGLSLALTWLGQKRAPLGRFMLLGLYLAAACLSTIGAPKGKKALYTFEPASAALAQSRPRRLIFFLDNPNSAILTPEQLKALGGFFFARSGEPIPVAPLVVPAGEDPNAAILARIKTGDAVLWLYDLEVPGTRARTYAPHLSRLSRAVPCRDLGGQGIGVLACIAGEGFKFP